MQGGGAQLLLEHPEEGALAFKAALLGDLGDGTVCLRQSRAGAGDADAGQVGREALAHLLGEHVGQVVLVHAQLPGQGAQGEGLPEVLPHVLGDLIGQLPAVGGGVLRQAQLGQGPGQHQLNQRAEHRALPLEARLPLQLLDGVGHVGVQLLPGKEGVLRVAAQQSVGVAPGVGEVAHHQHRPGAGLQGSVAVHLVGENQRQGPGPQHLGLAPHRHRGAAGKHQKQLQLGVQVQREGEPGGKMDGQRLVPGFDKGVHVGFTS